MVVINSYVVVVLGILGFVAGSFLSAYTYRVSVGKNVWKGRSLCPHCKKKIEWHDNIPLLSFILLKGKCRKCGKKISLRYPLIEFSTAIIFASTYIFATNCATTLQDTVFNGEVICIYTDSLGMFSIPFLLLILSILLAIFVIDFENQIIPDELVYLALNISIAVQLLFSFPAFLTNLFLAFSAGAFLLLMNLVTKGKGMGLGDVKLALLGGFLLGWPVTVTWFYLSFIIGAIVGIILIFAKKAKFGRQIAFGPFLIIALFVSLIVGGRFTESLFSIFP